MVGCGVFLATSEPQTTHLPPQTFHPLELFVTDTSRSDQLTTELGTLPVLPLRNGVVFPHMVVTLRIETAEGKIALAAAIKSDNQMILVPRVQGKYASVGTIAEIQQSDDDGNV